jgi:hypothetical protein
LRTRTGCGSSVTWRLSKDRLQRMTVHNVV